MFRQFVLVLIAFTCLVGAAQAQDDSGGGDFSVGSSDSTYTSSNGCDIGYCDETFGSSWSGDTAVDLTGGNGVSQRFIDEWPSSQFTWQDGVPIPTTQVQAQASAFQQDLSALAGNSQVDISTAPLSPSLDSQGPPTPSGEVPSIDTLATIDNAKTIWDVTKALSVGDVTGALVQLGSIDSPWGILLGQILDPPSLNQNEFPPGWKWPSDTTLQPVQNEPDGNVATINIVPDVHFVDPNAPPGNYNGLDSNGNYIHVNSQGDISADNILQDMQSWQMMQEMFASLNQRAAQTSPGGPTKTTTTTGTASSSAQSSSSTGLCPNPAAVASMTGPAPGHNGTTAYGGSCPPQGCVVGPDAPSTYIPMLIPCSQVSATPAAAMHEAIRSTISQMSSSTTTSQSLQAQAFSQKATQRAQVSPATMPSKSTAAAPKAASTPQSTKVYPPSANAPAAGLQPQPQTGKGSRSVGAQVTAPPNSEGHDVLPSGIQTRRSGAGGNWRPPGDIRPPFLFRSQAPASLQAKVEPPSVDHRVSSHAADNSADSLRMNATRLPNAESRPVQQPLVVPVGKGKEFNGGSLYHTQKSNSVEMQENKPPSSSPNSRVVSSDTAQLQANRRISTPTNFTAYAAGLPPQVANRIEKASKIPIEERATARAKSDFTWKGQYAKAISPSSSIPAGPGRHALREEMPFRVADLDRALPGVVQPVANLHAQMHPAPKRTQTFPVTAPVQYQSTPVEIHRLAQPVQTFHVAASVPAQTVQPVQRLQVITPVQHLASPPVQTIRVLEPVQTYQISPPVQTYRAVPLQQAPQAMEPVQIVPHQTFEAPRVATSTPVRITPAPVAAPRYVPAPTPTYRPAITFPRR